MVVVVLVVVDCGASLVVVVNKFAVGESIAVELLSSSLA